MLRLSTCASTFACWSCDAKKKIRRRKTREDGIGGAMTRKGMTEVRVVVAGVLLTVSVICVGICSGLAAAQHVEEKKTDATKPISVLSWLVGGVWTADASKMAPGMQRIE